MRVTTPQITWHGGENGKNDPVLTADVHPCGVLATGGADADIRVWLLHLEEDKDEQDFQDFLYNLGGHEKSVNVVRFSPNGRVLASASDGGLIVLHRLPEDRPLRTWCFASKASKVIEMKPLRTTQDDIYDLCWSPSSNELASSSVDHKVFVWNAVTRKHITSFDDHHNYVQGVCWDPQEKYIVSESNDRSCRIYTSKFGKGKKRKNKKKQQEQKDAEAAAAAAAAAATDGTGVAPGAPPAEEVASKTDSNNKQPEAPPLLDFVLCCTLSKVQRPSEDKAKPVEEVVVADGSPTKQSDAPASATSAEPATTDTTTTIDDSDQVPAPASVAAAAAAPKRASNPRMHLFADETVPTFFRRAAWSPDGCLLVTPTGIRRESPNDRVEFVTHVWARDRFEKPVMQLPNGSKASVAVRFCPQLFALRESKEPSRNLTNLPYRMVYAVLTVNTVLVYDTQHYYPIAIVRNTHLASLTDAAWLPDGRALVATSMDGYVTVLAFPDGELGEPIDLAQVPPVVRRLHRPVYELKERDAEDEELDRLEEKERAEAAAAKAERLAAKKAEEEEERKKKELMKEKKRQEKEEKRKQQEAEDGEESGDCELVDDDDDDDEVVEVVRRPLRSTRSNPGEVVFLEENEDGDESEDLCTEDGSVDDDDDDDDSDDDDGGDGGEEEAEEDGVEKAAEEQSSDKMEEDNEESEEEEELDLSNGAKDQKKDKKAKEGGDSSCKRKSGEMLKEDAAQNEETGKPAKAEEAVKKAKRIAPILVQAFPADATSNPSATPTVVTSPTAATASSTTSPAAMAATDDEASKPGGSDGTAKQKKRLAPTLVSTL